MRRHLFCSGLLACCAACVDTSVEIPPPGPPAAIQVVAGDEQIGTVGTELASPLVIRVVDASGRAVPNQAVRFGVAAGHGTISGVDVTTDSGTASARWILGTATQDTQTVDAQVISNDGSVLTSQAFHARTLPGPPERLLRLAGDSQTAFADSDLPESLAVRLVDRYGNAVAPLRQIEWTVGPVIVGVAGASAIGGSTSPIADSTDPQGIARTRWTLGPPYSSQPDTQTILAVFDTLAPVKFVAVAVPLTLQVRISVTNAMPEPFDEYTLIVGADSLQTGLAFQAGVAADTATSGNRGHACLASAQAHRQRTLTFLGVVPGSTGEQLLQRLSAGTPERDAWADSMAQGLVTVSQFEARLGSDLIASADPFDPIPPGVATPDTVHWTWTAAGAGSPTLAPADTACRSF